MERLPAVSACSALFSRRCCLQLLFCRLLFACHSLPAMPTALFNSSCPVHLLQFACPRPFNLALFATCSLPCAPGSSSARAGGLFVSQGQQFASCETVPLAAATRACSGGPCDGPFVLTHLYLSLCRVHDPGPWVSLEYKVKLFVVNMCAPPACLLFESGNVVKSSA